tara:strand:- start:85131 stop:85856 length:726 start_codon:yes stop_codon:yes gene_type:complete
MQPSNRRQDHRITAPSAKVKIRKRGGFHRWNNDVTLVNVSSSGLSITSSSLNLNTLNKVEFELTLDRETILGSAIVCHIGNDGLQQKYGLLFITANTDIDHLINGSLLSTDQAKRLGEELAERFIHQKNGEIPNPELKKQNQLMLDAVKAMAIRLGEMGLRVKDDSGNQAIPDKTLFVIPKGGLSFLSLATTNQVVRISVSVIKQDNQQFIYQLSSGEQLPNLVDLLNHICAAFDQISTAA